MSESRLSVDIRRAADVLNAGGIIGLPTETVYGLAALALNSDAVERVFAVKGRPRHHPLIIHLASIGDLNTWGVLDEHAHRLAKTFMPGPLTLLVPRASIVPDWVTGGRDTVALRVPDHPIAHRLLSAVATAVVAPSANRFGKVSPTTAAHVASDLGEDVDLILDGGPCIVGVESTIVECINDEVRVLRQGAVTEEEIEKCLATEIFSDIGESRAPGMLKSHYAPHARVVLVESVADAHAEVERAVSNGERVVMVQHEDNHTYAENLYSDLRNADETGATLIVAVLPRPSGLGRAVRDRLMKAAADQTLD